MTWNGRVSFVLTEGMSIKKIKMLDVVLEQNTSGQASKDDDGGFDADVAISTGELRQLIPDLIAALGGEQESGFAAAGTATPRADADRLAA